MPPLPSWFCRVVAAVLLLSAAPLSHGQPATATTTPIVVQGLGKGTAPLSGPWRFHLGDNPSWAAPAFDDSTWQQVTADLPWGRQGHDRYTGYAWYRCRLTLTPAPGVAPQFSLLLQRVDDAYEIYWNGNLIGRNGRLDPYRIWYYSQKAQIFALGPGPKAASSPSASGRPLSFPTIPARPAVSSPLPSSAAPKPSGPSAPRSITAGSAAASSSSARTLSTPSLPWCAFSPGCATALSGSCSG